MMIVPHPERFSAAKLQQKIFKVYSTMLEVTYQQVNLSHWMFTIEVFIQIAAEIWLLTSPTMVQLWDIQQMRALGKICEYVTSQGLSSQYPTMYQLTLIAMQIFIFITVACFCYLLYSETEKKATLIFATTLFRVSRMIGKFLLGCLVYNTFNDFEGNTVISKIISGVCTVLFSVFLAIYSRLSFNPLPKNNSYFRLDTNYDSSNGVVCLAKIIVIFTFPFSYSLLICCFVLEAAKQLYEQHYVASAYVRIFVRLPAQIFLASTFFTLLTKFIPKSRPLFYFWVLTLILLSFYKWMQLPAFVGNQIQLDNCIGNDRKRVCSFVRQYWEAEELPEAKKVSCYFGFLTNHIGKCQSVKCRLKDNRKLLFQAVEKSDMGKIEQQMSPFVMDLLKQTSSNDDVLSTLYFIQMFQNRNLKGMQNFNRRVTYTYQIYIMYHLNRLVDKDLQSQSFKVTEQNFIETKLAFIKQLRIGVQFFISFFDQLNSKKVRLTILEKLGSSCYDQVQQARKLFLRLLENKLDLSILSFYLEFIINFLGDKAVISDIVGRIKKKTTLQKYQDYSVTESPQPVIQIDIKTGKVININMQAVKIVGVMKEDLIDKPLSYFVYPNLEQEQWQGTFEKLMNSPLLSFCKNHQGKVSVVRIHSRIKQISNKKKYYLELIPVKCFYGQIYALINKQKSIIISSQSQILIDGDLVQFDQIFKMHIQPSWSQLVRNHNLKIQCGEDTTATISFSETLGMELDCIYIELAYFNGTSTREDQPLSHHLQFYLWKEGDKIVMEGMPFVQLLEKVKVCEIEDLKESFEQPIIQSIIQQNKNYAKDIKSYRLLGDRLYCIQLQDPVSLLSLAEQNRNLQNKQLDNQQDPTSWLLKLCYTTLSFFILFILIKQAIHRSNISSINQVYKSYGRIQMFQLRFYWLSNIFRDVDLNLDSSAVTNNRWSTLSRQIIADMQFNDLTKLFTDKIRTTNFLEMQYSMGLDEINDMILAHVKKALDRGNSSISKEINRVLAVFLQKAVMSEKEKVSEQIYGFLQEVTVLSWVAFAINTFMVAIFILLILMIEVSEIKKRSCMFTKYLMMSDMQIISYRTRLNNFQNFLALEERGVETEVFNTLYEGESIATRPVPKDLFVSVTERRSLIVILTLLFIVGLAAFSEGVAFTSVRNNTLSKCFELNKALSDSYINYAYLAINAMSDSDQDILKMIFDNLDTIEALRGSMPFSNQFSTYMQGIYYDNSCQVVSSLYPHLDCQNTYPNTLFINPFQSGLTYFFHHAYFSLGDKFLQARAYVGVDAHPFIKLAEDIINQTRIEWEKIINDVTYSENIFITTHISVFLLCVILLYAFLKDHRQRKRVAGHINKLVTVAPKVEEKSKESNKEMPKQARSSKVFEIIEQ